MPQYTSNLSHMCYIPRPSHLYIKYVYYLESDEWSIGVCTVPFLNSFDSQIILQILSIYLAVDTLRVRDYWVGRKTSRPLLNFHTSTASIVQLQYCSGFLRTSILDSARNLQTEDHLIFIGSTEVQPRVIDPRKTKLDTDMLSSPLLL